MKNNQNRAKNVQNPEVVSGVLLTDGSSFRGFRKPISQEEFFARLDKMVEGESIVAASDKRTWQLLTVKAKRKGMTPEEYLKHMGYKYHSIKRAQDRSKFLTDDDCRRAIIECADPNGVVTMLDKNYPTIRTRINRICKKAGVGFETALNMFMGVADGTYTYPARSSVFGFGKLSVLGDDEEVNQKVAEVIRSCMDENNFVVNLKKNSRSVFDVITKLSDLRGITFEEALRVFVPEANYRSYSGITLTEAKAAKLCQTFNDGSGCIDALRGNATFNSYIRRLAKEHGISVNEQLEALGGYFYSKNFYEVDVFDFVRVWLDLRFGETKDASGLEQIDNKLYQRVRALRYNVPGGALRTNEEMLAYFGYSYNGYRRETKFTREFVAKILYEKYGDQKVITNIFDDKNVGNAMFYYSGIVGKSFKDTLADFGYEYNESGGMRRCTYLVLTPDEYRTYLRHKKEMEQPVAVIKKPAKEVRVADEQENISAADLFDDEPGTDE